MTKTMLPPAPDDYNEGSRLPYVNEFILLSFEGHLRPLEPPPTRFGKRPSYVPSALWAAGEEPEIAQSGLGFFEYWKSKLTTHYE